MPEAEQYVGKGLVYQNPFIYWYNHKNEKDYQGPRYETPDEAVVVDALAPGIDLKPFFDLMGNERVLKVFHAARQDIEIV